MRKTFLLVFSVIVLFWIVPEKNAKEEGKKLGIEVMSQETIDLLCSEKEFINFETNITFEGYELGYDAEQNMLLIPQELDKKYFHGILIGEKEKLVFLEDNLWDDKENAISSNHVFRLFRIGKDRYWMYNVYFTGMPVAKLSTYQTGEVENYGKMWVYDQYKKNSSRYQEGKCRFRKRGASSRNFPKPSYKVTFTEDDFSLLGMRKDDDWILNSLYDDEGLIHNKISYELWKQIANDNHVANDEGISMEYVEVFVDNTYMGVYGLLERVDKKLLKLNEMDILYKGVDSKDIGEDDFYLELTEGMSPAFEIKYPKTFSQIHWKPLKEWVYNLDCEQITEYGEAGQILNMENAVDYLLFTMFISGGDNTRKNIYYWADYKQNGTYQIIKIPWDLNMTWGNGWCENHEYHFNLYQEKYIDKLWIWTGDMYYLYQLNPTEISRKMYERWKELRENIITKESIYGMLDVQFDYIHTSGAYIRNCMFWGNREKYWSDSYIYEYTDKKIDAMEKYMLKCLL